MTPTPDIIGPMEELQDLIRRTAQLPDDISVWAQKSTEPSYLQFRDFNIVARARDALLIAVKELQDYVDSCEGFGHKPHCYCLPAVEALHKIRKIRSQKLV